MPRHHWIVRLTHWVNALALTIMVTSGLRIFNAYPAFARHGETFPLNPWEGRPFPAVLTFGGWLGGARQWHFAMMWVLVANGLVYLAFVYLHGEWRDLVPRRGDLLDTIEMIRYYTFVRKDHPIQGKHNALQKAAYFSMPLIAALTVITGLAIWKPVQFAPLTELIGGYALARFWHFLCMSAIVIASLGHVFMVFSVDPYALRGMITGGHSDRFSPEARNARPFLNLWPRRASAPATTEPTVTP
jgi:Ni/Fe-hydrogenase b-type cytochrome subunit